VEPDPDQPDLRIRSWKEPKFELGSLGPTFFRSRKENQTFFQRLSLPAENQRDFGLNEWLRNSQRGHSEAVFFGL